MSQTPQTPTSVAMLMGMPVVDANGRPCGEVTELTVDISRDSGHIAGFIIRKRFSGKAGDCYLPVEALGSSSVSGRKFKAKTNPVPTPEMEDYLLMDRDLLDQQIIDVDGRKVVRVNDVELFLGVRKQRPGATYC